MSNRPQAIILIEFVALLVIVAVLEIIAFPHHIKKSYLRYVAKKQRAFTLIELMVVIAIIAILAMIGYRNDYTGPLPLLQQLGLSATSFPVGDYRGVYKRANAERRGIRK